MVLETNHVLYITIILLISVNCISKLVHLDFLW